MIKRVLSLLIMTFTMVFVLSSCSTGGLADKDTLKVGTLLHNGLYNPLYATTVYDEDVCNLIYEGLVQNSPKGLSEVNERLVEKFSVSEDGKSYTFMLKSGITFSNGKPLIASDVVFTYKTLADPSSTASKHQYVEALEGGREYMVGESDEFIGVELIDPLTVTFHFSGAQRANLDICSVKIISESYYPDWEQGNADFYMHDKMKNPMGSGPYKLKEFSAGEKVVLEKNKKYWAENITDYNIKYIEISFLKNQELLPALKSGEINFVPQIVNVNTYEGIKEWVDSTDNVNMDFTIFQRNSYGFLGFNTRSGDGADVALRQAIAYSLNRKGFIEDYFGEYGEPATAQMPSSSDLYTLIESSINHYDFDIAKAQELLESNGYILENGVLLKDNDPVKIKFLATADNETVTALTEEIQRSFDQLGIELEVVETSFSNILDTIKSEDDNWNMFFMADDWRGDDPNELTVYFSSLYIPKTNVTRYTNPLVDQFLKQGEMNMEAYSQETLENYKEVLLALNIDLPEIPIYTSKAVAIQDKSITGLNFGTYQRWSEGIEGAKLAK